MRASILRYAPVPVLLACGARTELPAPIVCGDGIVDRGEECDLGAANSDAPAPFVVSQGSTTFEVAPLTRPQSAVSFYDYVGASSFTGLEVEGESRIYLYLDSTTSKLALFVNHNIFGQGKGAAKMSLDDLPSGFSIALSDESGELKSTGSSSAKGNWAWTKNTDGGVIGNLTCPGAWTIRATPTFTSGITSWTWVNADTSRTPLAMDEPVTVAAAARCRTNCTIPACGQ